MQTSRPTRTPADALRRHPAGRQRLLPLLPGRVTAPPGRAQRRARRRRTRAFPDQGRADRRADRSRRGPGAVRAPAAIRRLPRPGGQLPRQAAAAGRDAIRLRRARAPGSGHTGRDIAPTTRGTHKRRPRARGDRRGTDARCRGRTSAQRPRTPRDPSRGPHQGTPRADRRVAHPPPGRSSSFAAGTPPHAPTEPARAPRGEETRQRRTEPPSAHAHTLTTRSASPPGLALRAHSCSDPSLARSNTWSGGAALTPSSVTMVATRVGTSILSSRSARTLAIWTIQTPLDASIRRDSG